MRELHRALGPLTVIWDRSNIPSRAKVVKAFLAGHPDRVAGDFPGYVPELNPDEGAGGWTKDGRLANLAAADTQQLRESITGELKRLKQRPDLLRAFLRQTRLPGVVNVREPEH